MSEINIINNYVDIPDDNTMCLHKNDNTILFLGKMNYEPNITAVTYFAKKIFPFLREKYPSLKFIIVGAQPTNAILNLSQQSGIIVTGYVETLEPYFREATIVVAPMLSGAGVQNKIIQAMSYGCCVATTTIGAEGLVLKGNDLAIFNGDVEWINGILLLLDNKPLRYEMGKSARDTIKRTLSKEIIYRQFCQLLEKLK